MSACRSNAGRFVHLQVMLDFALSEQMYAKARVADVSSVALWLGADVMLEYPLQEAKQLLVRQGSKLDGNGRCSMHADRGG